MFSPFFSKLLGQGTLSQPAWLNAKFAKALDEWGVFLSEAREDVVGKPLMLSDVPKVPKKLLAGWWFCWLAGWC